MATKIEIKPNDQSLVGSKIRASSWEDGQWFLVQFVGREYMFGVYQDGEESIVYIEPSHNWWWELYEEPAPQFEAGDVLVGPEGERWGVLKYNTFWSLDEDTRAFSIWRSFLKDGCPGKETGGFIPREETLKIFSTYKRIPAEQAWVEPGRTYFDSHITVRFRPEKFDCGEWEGVELCGKMERRARYRMQEREWNVIALETKKVLKPAIVEKYVNGRFDRVIMYFASELEARDYCDYYKLRLLQYPARLELDLEYEVEDE